MSQPPTHHQSLFVDPEDSADDTPPPADIRAEASTLISRSRSRGDAMSFCVLGSGSGGNCAAVSVGGRVLLIDLGFGPRTTATRLMQAGVALDDVAGVCLTHLDQDHFRPHWIDTLVGWRIPVHLHAWHATDLREVDRDGRLFDAGLVRTFDDRAFEPVAGVRVQPVRLAHDSQGTSGYRLDHGNASVGYATDLGHVPDALIHAFAGVGVLALESNYDPPMQLRSPRPLFLKRRIMGPAGHLSNEQSFDAVRRILARGPDDATRHIVLLHRSQQCNTPEIVRQVFSRDAAIARRVVLTEQRRRTRWFPAEAGQGGRQLQLFA